MLKIGGAHGMGMKFDAAEIHDPGEAGRIIDYNLFRGPARRERERDRSQPRRALRRGALLIKGFSLSAVDEAFENNWTVVDSGERTRRNGKVVADEIEFGNSCLREIELIGMRDADFTPVNR
jgi:hypothetical protein